MPAKGKGAPKLKSQGQPGPSGKSRGPDGRRTKKKTERDQGTQPAKKKRKARASGETPSPERKVMVTPGQRAKWKLLPESTRAYLESMMRGLILSIIYESPQNQGDIEKHLNLLKERLLKCFETLRVPMEKQSSLKNVRKLQEEEEEKIAAIERGLEELEVFRKGRDDVLALPKLPKESLGVPVLQELILKIPNQAGVLRDLNDIQRSKEMKAMLDYLEQAYEAVDKYSVPNQEGRSSYSAARQLQ